MSEHRGLATHTKILIGLIIGAALGLAADYVRGLEQAHLRQVAEAGGEPHGFIAGAGARIDWFASNVTEPIGKVFLRLMFMVVLPLVLSALTLAVVELGDIRRLGRIGLKTLTYTGAFSFAAVLIGVTLVNVIQPGLGLPEEKRNRLLEQSAKGAGEKVEQAKKAKSVTSTLLDIIPENPVQEMVGAVDGSSKGNGMLAIMFFALVMGIAITTVPRKTNTLVQCLEGFQAVSMVVVGFAMKLAPVCASCLVFSIVARLGLHVLVTLGWYVATVLLGLAIQLFVVYPVMLILASDFTPAQFFRGVREAMVVAFGTSSSSATLPTAIRVADESLKLPARVSKFVLTVGATGNQNGTALYEGVTVLFLAQLYSGGLPLQQQILVVLMSVLAGVGTAGVPGGSLPLIVVVLQSVDVPGEYIGIILGVDRILDMCRTVLNVTGDLAIATCVSRGESPTASTPTSTTGSMAGESTTESTTGPLE